VIDLLTPSQRKNMSAASGGYGTVSGRGSGVSQLRDDLDHHLRAGTVHSYVAKAMQTVLKGGGMFWPELWEVDWTQPAFLEIADRERVFGSFQAFYSEMVEPWMGEWRRLTERYRRYAEATTPEAKQHEREEAAAEIATRIANAAKATNGEVLPEGRPPAPEAGQETAQFRQLSQSKRAKENGVSRYTQQKLDALARLRPDLLEEVRAGRKSAHRAATEAGIVKAPDPLDRLRKAWNDAQEGARREFLREAWDGVSEEDKAAFLRGIGATPPRPAPAGGAAGVSRKDELDIIGT
jgi:hypothetical protein